MCTHTDIRTDVNMYVPRIGPAGLFEQSCTYRRALDEDWKRLERVLQCKHSLRGAEQSTESLVYIRCKQSYLKCIYAFSD